MKNFKITPPFHPIFFTVLFLTLLPGGTSLWLACPDALSPHQDRIFESSTATWQMGVGAIFDLLGGKAADLFQPEEK